MKNLLIIILMTLLSSGVQAQQNTASFISNPYIQNSNLLSTVTALNNYRASVGLDVYPDDEISDNAAYYKFSYKQLGTSIPKQGLIDIRCAKNTGKSNPIEKVTESYYHLFMVDDDENDYTKEFVKTSTVHGGYFFNKKYNHMYIIMLTQPYKDFVFATIEINDLTVEQKKALARDFIENTVFQ